MNRSISSQQNVYIISAPINANNSFQSQPTSSYRSQMTNQNTSRNNQNNSMQYSSSSYQSNYNQNEQILPYELSSNINVSNGSSQKNQNLVIIDQPSYNHIGPSFFHQSSNDNYHNSSK